MKIGKDTSGNEKINLYRRLNFNKKSPYGSMKAGAMHESLHIRLHIVIKVSYFFPPPLFFPRPFPFQSFLELLSLSDDVSDDSILSSALSV